MNNTTVVITNPGEDAQVIKALESLTPQSVINNYHESIERGAFVAVIDIDSYYNTFDVKQFIADKTATTVFLQDNSRVPALEEEDGADIDEIGAVVSSLEITPPVTLVPFTVFGTNDDDEAFTAVVSATEETVYEVGRVAGSTLPGYEGDVVIALVLPGDQSGIDRVSAA